MNCIILSYLAAPNLHQIAGNLQASLRKFERGFTSERNGSFNFLPATKDLLINKENLGLMFWKVPIGLRTDNIRESRQSTESNVDYDNFKLYSQQFNGSSVYPERSPEKLPLLGYISGRGVVHMWSTISATRGYGSVFEAKVIPRLASLHLKR